MPKVSDLNGLNAVDVDDIRDIKFLVSNLQGTPESQQVTGNEIAKFSQHIVIEQTSHGLVSGDVGKPLVGVTPLNDVTYGVYPTWVLASVIDANTIVVAPLGALIELPTTLLTGGNSYNTSTSGYDLYWDASSIIYTATRPAGSAGQVNYALTLVDINTADSTFTAIVRITSKTGDTARVFEVVGTGNSAVDDISMAAAVAAANAAGYGSVVLLNGHVQVENNYTMQGISLLGKKGTSPKLEVKDDGGIFSWNGSYSPITSGTTIPATAAKQAWLAVPPGLLAGGDWFLAIADDTIEGVTHTEGPVSNSTYTATTNSGTDTITTSSAHGYTVGNTVMLTTTHTLPGGLSLSTLYYVVAVPTTTTLQVSLTSGGAVVDITDTGTGTHTIQRAATADAVTDVITFTSHGFSDNHPVIIQSPGTMPSGLSANQTYWVRDKTTHTFKLAATRGGSAINITSAGSGPMLIRTIYANCPLEVHQVKDIRGSAPTNVITSIASSVLTANGHNYVNGQVVKFTTTGTLPTGITADTGYFIINKTTNTFQISTSSGGSAVSLSGGSGTHTAVGYDYVVFDDYIVDALTVNPRIVVMTDVYDGFEIGDFEVAWTGTATQEAPMFNIRKSVNVTIRDFHSTHNGPTSIQFLYCGNVICHHHKIESKATYVDENGYHLVCGAVNRLIFSDSVAVGCRHVFTTDAQISNGARYGTPRNVLVTDIVASMDGKYYSTLVPFDTHAEGWRVTFQNIRVSVPYEPRTETLAVLNSNRALQSRSRGTIFSGCIIEGNDLTNGIYIMGSYCKVLHCEISDCWRGVYVRQDNSGAVTSGVVGTVIAHNTFEDCEGPGVMCDFGDSHRVTFNDFSNCGQVANTPVPKCIVYFDGGTDYTCTKNVMNRDSNTLAVGGAKVTAANFRRFTGNDMVGYTGVSGATDSGFDSTNPDATALQALADAYCVTD